MKIQDAHEYGWIRRVRHPTRCFPMGYKTQIVSVNYQQGWVRIKNADDTYHQTTNIEFWEPTEAPFLTQQKEKQMHPQTPANLLYPTPLDATGTTRSPVDAAQTKLSLAQEAVEQAEKALEAAKAAQAVQDRLTHEVALANATVSLLAFIREALGGNYTAATIPRPEFAKFRVELSALAATYGHRIVLVGDKSKASLTKA